MKGVILAGGSGARLFPSTKVVNKHLLPVFDRPMVFYPIETLKASGVRDILIICDTKNAGDFMRLLGSGKDLGVNLTFKVQDGAGGTAEALMKAESFAKDDLLAVIYGDNIFENSFSEDVLYFQKGAKIFVKKVENPEQFGVVDIDEKGLVVGIEEKPSFPKSNFALTGFFLFDSAVFGFMKDLSPSELGELELTDVIRKYSKKKMLELTEIFGMWADAGTHEGLLEASILANDAFDPKRIESRKQKSLNVAAPDGAAKVVMGLATYNSEKYIESCLSSLLAQNYENVEVVIFDNNSQDKTVATIRENFSSEKVRIIESTENVGFSRAHNEILRATDSEFYACLNIDMIFEPNFISESVKSINEKPIFGSTGGKIKKWDFDTFKGKGGLSSFGKSGKTNFIDSAGLKIFSSHRFENIGEGEVDYGQFNESKEVFGFSGAAVLYRRKALEDVAFINEKGEKEFFDESMFLYKEDIDLAYRLQWAGWKARFEPNVASFHDRTVQSIGNRVLDLVKNRSKKAKAINRVSYLNHQILLRKNFSSKFSSSVRFSTFWYNFKSLMYVIFFETELLTEFWKIFKLRKKISERKKSTPHRVSGMEIEKLMEN